MGAGILSDMTKHATAAKAGKTPPPTTPRRVQTTLVLSEDLWRAVKIRAVDERTDLRDICTRALRAYLETPLLPPDALPGRGRL